MHPVNPAFLLKMNSGEVVFLNFSKIFVTVNQLKKCEELLLYGYILHP